MSNCSSLQAQRPILVRFAEQAHFSKPGQTIHTPKNLRSQHPTPVPILVPSWMPSLWLVVIIAHVTVWHLVSPESWSEVSVD